MEEDYSDYSSTGDENPWYKIRQIEEILEPYLKRGHIEKYILPKQLIDNPKITLENYQKYIKKFIQDIFLPQIKIALDYYDEVMQINDPNNIQHEFYSDDIDNINKDLEKIDKSLIRISQRLMKIQSKIREDLEIQHNPFPKDIKLVHVMNTVIPTLDTIIAGEF